MFATYYFPYFFENSLVPSCRQEGLHISLHSPLPSQKGKGVNGAPWACRGNEPVVLRTCLSLFLRNRVAIF